VPLRPRQKLGKYRIEKCLSEGGFAAVYQAHDTIEGIRVALKIPHSQMVSESLMKDFRNEARLAAKLEHPNILHLKDASVIDGYFVIALPLGEKTLADRLMSRLSIRTVVEYTGQMLEALAYAHRQRIIHCDVKPENMLLFPGNRLRLTDFGIAKVAQKTVRGSGTGTVGYMAPEQAMGKPSLRSDVFSLGLIVYRMLSGEWAEWPFAWPPAGYQRVRGRVYPEFVSWIRKSMELDPRKRFHDADQMLRVFRTLEPHILDYAIRRRRSA
jgi:serine/threonine protein kinase